MRTWTYRKYLAVLAWLDHEWNRPSRSDHYAMQIAEWVSRSQDLDSMKIHFDYVEPKPEKPKLTKEEIVKRSKARWAAAVGLKPP
jgi:hypothetical protein